ncbi:MAG TPA: chitobiase/beta-hexosaminidase C-terminal domain-containing protein [Candidatus Paceibacterota bacterium]
MRRPSLLSLVVILVVFCLLALLVSASSGETRAGTDRSAAEPAIEYAAAGSAPLTRAEASRFATLLQIIAAWLASLRAASASPGTTNASRQIVLYDFVQELKPQTTAQSIVFPKPDGCALGYSIRGSAVTTSWATGVRPSAKVVSYIGGLLPDVTFPLRLCSPEKIIESGPGWARVSVRGPMGGIAQSLTVAPDRIVMRDNTNEQYAKVFNTPTPFFPKEVQPAAINHSIDVVWRHESPTLINLADYSSLELTLDLQITKADVTAHNVSGTPPSGATTLYDPEKHAERFFLDLMVLRDLRCDLTKYARDQRCEYEQSSMYVRCALFDTTDEWCGTDGSGQALIGRITPTDINAAYWLDWRDLLPPGTTQNPFKHGTRRGVLKGDILPLLKDALLRAESEIDATTGKPFLLPREPNETDEQYFAHYTMGNTRLASSMYGLSDMEYTIRDYKLVGTQKGSPAPHAYPFQGQYYTYSLPLKIEFAAPQGASIRYTKDGSTPTCASGTLYDGLIRFQTAAPAMIKAVACYPGGMASAVAVFQYTFIVSSDTKPPPVPTGIVAIPRNIGDEPRVRIRWTPSIDDVLTTGYHVFRDGVEILEDGHLPRSASMQDVTNLEFNHTYRYRINAFDRAGNVSALSAPFTVTTCPASGCK